MTPRRTIAAIALALGATLAAAGAQQPAPVTPPAPGAAASTRTPGDSALEARVREVAMQLRCPVCQGLSLYDSPSELSQEMTGLVREQLRAGKSPEEVKQYFVARYGEWILLEPQAHGFNWVVYLLPVGVLVLGGGVLALAVKRWTRGAPPGVDEPADEEEPAPTGIA